MDTTDEAAITGALRDLDRKRTLFLVASKSGGTIEPASMEKLFWAHMSRRLGGTAGRHFVAVTDPGTELARLAEQRGYRKIFLNPPDIGGRLLPLLLLRLWPRALLGGARARGSCGRARPGAGGEEENHPAARPARGRLLPAGG